MQKFPYQDFLPITKHFVCLLEEHKREQFRTQAPECFGPILHNITIYTYEEPLQQ